MFSSCCHHGKLTGESTWFIWWMQNSTNWLPIFPPPPPPPSLPWSARTVEASHKSPPVVSVHSHHHCFLNVSLLTAPHQNVVDPSPYRSLHLSSDFIVGDVVLPVDFQYVSVTSHLSLRWSSFFVVHVSAAYNSTSKTQICNRWICRPADQANQLGL